MTASYMFKNLLGKLRKKEATIAVLGLGYVGLPLAVAMATSFTVIGYDNNSKRLAGLNNGLDQTGEVDEETLSKSGIAFSNDASVLFKSTFHMCYCSNAC